MNADDGNFPHLHDIRLFPAKVTALTNFGYALLFVAAWVAAIVGQICFGVFWFVVNLPWSVIHIPYYTILLLLGYYLEQCKLYQHRDISRQWDLMFWATPTVQTSSNDTGVIATASNADGPENNDDSTRNFKDINESVLVELFLESIPQLIVQLINNLLTKQFGIFGILSTTGSVIVILSAVYRYGYWYMWRGVSLSDIPLFNDPSTDKT